jgi:hypothetical protein
VRLFAERKKNKSSSAKDLDILIKETAADKKVDVLWEQLEKTTQLLTSLPDDTITNILRNFELPVRFAGSLCTHGKLVCIPGGAYRYVDRVTLNGDISVMLVE